MKNKTPMPSVYDVAVGALLHDIGKLVQRGSDDDIPQVEISYAQWHSQWTEKFFNLIEEEKLSWPKCINLAWVRNLAVFYPKNGVSTSHSVTELVRVADSLASGDKVRSTHDMNEVTVQNWNEFKKKRLVALVPSLKLPENSFSRGGFHLPSSFDADSLMPSIGEEDKIGNQIFNMYKQVWTNFQKGWEEIVNAQSVSTCPGLFVEGLVSLMEKWFWAVPSSTVDEQSDISLFDHSRMVAAFSVALYHYHKVNNSLTSPSIVNDNKLSKFRLLIGDLSGIQTTLFRLSRESVSGLNRILRGRSLRFQFIADAAIRRLLEKFDLPWSSVLQTAGGRFLILVPDLGEEITNIRINQLRTEKEQWLVENYSGDLGFGIAITKPFSAQKIINETYEDCQVEIEKRARLIREEVIISSETAKLRLFQEPAKRAVLKFDYHDGICKVCGIRPAKSENQEDLCKTCMEEKKLGRCYPKANMVVIEKRDSNAEIFGLSYKLPLPNENTQKYQEKKGWQFRNGEQLGSAVFRPGYCYVPTFVEENSNNIKNLEGHGDIKTFEDLAKIPRGREILALFKADMDRLGELFNKGITPWSFAKTSTLSRMIDGYFSLRLQSYWKMIIQTFTQYMLVAMTSCFWGHGTTFLILLQR